MKLAHFCLKASITFLQLNFTLLIILKSFKVILDNNSSNKLRNNSNTINSKERFQNDVAFEKIFNYKSDFVMNLNSADSKNADNYKKAKYYSSDSADSDVVTIDDTQYENSLANKFELKSSHFDFDPHSLLLNKTKTYNFVNKNQKNKKQIMVTTTLVNFEQLLEFHNLKNTIQRLFFLCFNASCILTNILMLAYLISYHKTKITYFDASTLNDKTLIKKKNFLNLNMCFNCGMLMIICLINLMQFIIHNENFLGNKNDQVNGEFNKKKTNSFVER
jgi:hypothetical protein